MKPPLPVPLPLQLHRVCPTCGRSGDQLSRVDLISLQMHGRCYDCVHPQRKTAPTIRKH
jgi:hypothetical protein